MKKITLKLILISLIFSACASRPSAVAPVAVSVVEYQTLTCDETKTLLAQKREEENALSRAQSNAATGDAASVFLFLLPLGSVFGADVEGELALAKGEVNALERAVPINCKIILE